VKEMTEGKLLRDIRDELDLTQRELAEEIGTRQQAIAMMENGKRGVSKKVVKALNKVFGIDFYGSLNVGNIVRAENDEECSVEETYRLNLTAKVKSLSTVNKVMELLKNIEEISVLKVDEGYYQLQEV
jgi:transcriptional regulator with XRE-family HTH domain